jgi:hypothetical protein
MTPYAANDPLLRAPSTRYREVTRTTEQHNWNTKDRGLEEPMDDVNKQEESRSFDMESSTAIWLTGGELFVTETYRDEGIRSDRLRVRQDDDTNVINENSGILLKVADLG